MSNKAKEELKDILAIMHGDGGHYTLKHGLKKSYQDAIKGRNIMVAKIDSLQNENNRLRELLVEVERFLKCTMDGHDRCWADLNSSAIKARRSLGESCEK